MAIISWKDMDRKLTQEEIDELEALDNRPIEYDEYAPAGLGLQGRF